LQASFLRVEKVSVFAWEKALIGRLLLPGSSQSLTATFGRQRFFLPK
jgi:hypothetical protein